jgi:hypothetical protein
MAGILKALKTNLRGTFVENVRKKFLKKSTHPCPEFVKKQNE